MATVSNARMDAGHLQPRRLRTVFASPSLADKAIRADYQCYMTYEMDGPNGGEKSL